MEIRDHALLYACMARAILKHLPKKEAEALIEKITVDYGFQRGKRMASFSKNGDLNDYFINGEWKGKEGENISKMFFKEDKTVSVVSKCAWYDTWKRYGLEEYGSYYCRFIDKAICEGFNKDLLLDVNTSIGLGDRNCEFVWHEKADEEKVRNTRREHILPFDHHCKELYDCMEKHLPEKQRAIILEEIKNGLKEL